MASCTLTMKYSILKTFSFGLGSFQTQIRALFYLEESLYNIMFKDAERTTMSQVAKSRLVVMGRRLIGRGWT